jgi:cysteine protease IpaJ
MATKTQNTALSCGAACLAVAGKELGVGDVLFPGTAAVSLNFQTSGLNGLETMLYKITGAGKGGYSMPADMCKAALLMGLEPTVHMYGSVYAPALSWMYPDAAQQCEVQGVAINREKPPVLAHNQRQFCVVSIGGMPLVHWVLYRPDMTYMDPACGEDFNWFIAMGQGPGYLLKYVDTGISVIVTA